MNKKRNTYLLILIFIICASIPILGIFFDFGGGTDDAASEIIEQTTGGGKPLDVDYFGYVPTDQTEPWLFVLQILIGVSIFISAYILLKRLINNKKRD